MAVDSAVMVLDCAKGIEPQTKKLFAVCRKRNIPIMTFINKMDLPGRHPYELLEEIRADLGHDGGPVQLAHRGRVRVSGVVRPSGISNPVFQRTLHNQRRRR